MVATTLVSRIKRHEKRIYFEYMRSVKLFVSETQNQTVYGTDLPKDFHFSTSVLSHCDV